MLCFLIPIPNACGHFSQASLSGHPVLGVDGIHQQADHLLVLGPACANPEAPEAEAALEMGDCGSARHRMAFLSREMATTSICLTRSRESPQEAPISARVSGSRTRPQRRMITSLNLPWRSLNARQT